MHSIVKPSVFSTAVLISILAIPLAGVRVAAADELVLQLGHTAPISAVAISHDARLAVTGSHDNTAIVWDLKSGRQLRTLRGHTRSVLSVAFAPDGQRVATSSEDKTLILWNLQTGKQLRVFRGHSDSVYDVAFSPDGTYVLSASSDKTAILWIAATGRPLRTFRGHKSSVRGVAFRGDGTQIATASLDNTVVVWNVMSAKPVRTFRGHQHGAYSVAFSPDGGYLLAGGGYPVAVPDDEGVSSSILWNVKTGGVVHKYKVRGFTNVIHVAFTPDGRSALSSAGPDLWDVKSGKTIRKFTGHRGKVVTASLSRDGRYLLAGAQDCSAILWDTATGKRLQHLRSRIDHFDTLLFSDDGLRMLSASRFVKSWRWSRRNVSVLWDLKTGKQLDSFSGNKHGSVAIGAAISPSGRRVFIQRGNGRGTIRNYVTGTTLPIDHQVRILGFEHLPSTFSRDSQFLLTGSPFGRLDHQLTGLPAMLREAKSGRLLRTFENKRRTSTSAVSFSDDGRRIATGLAHNKVILNAVVLWDVKTGREVLRMHSYGGTPVEDVVLSNDGKYAIVVYEELAKELWDLKSGKKLRTFPVRGRVTFSADSKRVGFFDLRNSGSWWEVGTGRQLHRFKLDLKGKLTSFTSDGRSMLYYNYNHATVLDTETGKVRVRVDKHKPPYLGSYSRTYLTTDGKYIVTHTNRDETHVWNAKTGKLIREFAPRGFATLRGGNRGPFVVTTKRLSGVYQVRDVATSNVLHKLNQLGNNISNVALSPSGDKLVVCPQSYGIKTRLFDTHTGKVLYELGDASLHFKHAKFSSDGRFVLTCGRQDISVSEKLATGWDAVGIWNVADGRRLRTFQGHRKTVTLVRFDPKGKRLLTVSQDVANLWEIDSGKKLESIRAVKATKGFAVSKDLSRLTRFSDRKAEIWNLVTARRLTVVHDAGDIRGVAFSVDAKRLLTQSLHEIIVWDALTGKCLRTLRAQDEIRSARFRPYLPQIASTHVDGSIRMWDLTAGREMARLYSMDSGDEWLTITSRGYFIGSPKAQQRVHWRKGDNVTPFADNRVKFGRPGIVAKRLSGGN